MVISMFKVFDLDSYVLLNLGECLSFITPFMYIKFLVCIMKT